MNKESKSTISASIWVYTWLSFSLGAVTVMLAMGCTIDNFLMAIAGTLVSLGASLPALVIVYIGLHFIKNPALTFTDFFVLLLILLLFTCSLYGVVPFIVIDESFASNALFSLGATAALFACNCISVFICRNKIKRYFYEHIAYTSLGEPVEATTLEPVNVQALTNSQNFTINNQIKSTMQQSSHDFTESQTPPPSNKILVKGVITGALILIMLIPTIFITNLVQEREHRQKEVVAEVSNKWAKPQTLTGPYIVVPYNETVMNSDNKVITSQRNVVLLPENLQVKGDIAAEQRPRSIYKVLLYKSNINTNGKFVVKVPTDIAADKLMLSQAKLCVGLTDFKGIEGPVAINFNGATYDLTAGLPANPIDSMGLSTPVPLTVNEFGKELQFDLQLKIKGSEQLSFIPLSGNSYFALHSTWPSPSFNGTTLPNERNINEKGFTASWGFNKANLPFNTFLKDFNFNRENLSFGVSMLQPADQYAKTMRSVKYAILFIGLTFSLFFIIELLQNKPVHPVQYILVGLALVIFYTLLLSISEYILFDYAYLIAAIATVLLITLYAKGHFQSWKVASVFGSVLASLYTFIFVLIRLEDTALLVGSIGLFIVLALVMYASRKINWYHPNFSSNGTGPVLE